MLSRLVPSTLLKPARDLAQNWSIDVASELEAYLTQVEEQQQQANRGKDGSSSYGSRDTDEDEPRHFNFIEAALMLQSGTSVYSKKVEYLLALTYETLNHFSASARVTSAQETSTRRGGRAAGKRHGKGAEDWDTLDTFFIPWNLVLEGKEDGSEYFLAGDDENDNPREAYIVEIPKDSAIPSRPVTQKPFPPTLTNYQLQHIPLLLVPRDDRSDFRVASLMVHPTTGALLVDPQDAFSFIGSGMLMSHATTMAPTSATYLHQFSMTPAIQITPANDVTPSATAVSNMVNGTGALLCGSTRGTGSILEALSEQATGDDAFRRQSIDIGAARSVAGESSARWANSVTEYDMATRSTVEKTGQGLRSKRSRLPVNPLQKLDCHQQLGRDRPQNIGKTTKAPDAEVYLASAKQLPRQRLEVFSELQRLTFISARWFCASTFETVFTGEMTSKPNSDDTITPRRVPEFPDLKCPSLLLADQYMLGPTWTLLEPNFAEVHRARAMQHKWSRRQDESGSPCHDWGCEYPKDTSLAKPYEESDEVDTACVDIAEDPRDTEASAIEHPGTTSTTRDAAQHIDTDIETAVLGAQLSYSDVLQQTLDLSIASEHRGSSADDFAALEDQVELHHRVAKWRVNVDRWLGVIRERPPFDVLEYKLTFARKLLDTESEELSSGNRIRFRDAVSGTSRSDVCRYFLTTLLLCNEEVLEIERDDAPKSSGYDFSILLKQDALEQVRQTNKSNVAEASENLLLPIILPKPAKTKKRRERETQKR